jgi:RNA polymerase sigma-70 factor (ECF subfamily)
MTPRDHDPLPCLHEHAAFLRALARRLCADPATADDVVQETFVRALHRPPRLRSARAWLASVARNVFRDHHAAENARKHREEEVARHRAAAAAQAGEADPLGIEHLTQALRGLPADYRHALQLRYYAQLSVDEMARELGVPAGTVKVRLHRGLALLRADFAARVGGEGRARALLAPLAAAPALPATGVFASLLGVLMMQKVAVGAAVAAILLAWAWPRGSPLESASAPPSGSPVASSTDRERNAGPTVADVVGRAGASPMPERDAVEAAGSPVVGRIVYASTGQGVPYGRVTVCEGDVAEELQADVDGRFATRRGYGAGAEIAAEGLRANASREVVEPIGVVAGESLQRAPQAGPAPRATERVWRRVDEFGDPGGVEIAVRLGPTYFVSLSLPAGSRVEDFEASLARSDTTSVAWLRDYGASQAPLREAGDGSARYWSRLPKVPYGDEPPVLFVWSRDGLWAGSAPVATVTGVQVDPVVIHLLARGIVRGVVRDRSGDPVRRTWVGLVSPRANAALVVSDRTDEDGGYVITHALPGPARLEVGGDHVESFQQAVDVPAGRELEQDLVVTARTIGGAIAGTITSDSGSPIRHSCVFLTSSHDASIWRRADIEWSTVDGSAQGTFAFDGVPLVECDVKFYTYDAYSVPVRTHRVTPPQPALSFHVADRAPMARVCFEVALADGDPPLEPWTVRVVGDGWSGVAEPTGPGAAEVQLPVGQSFTWLLVGQGVRARRGSGRADRGARIAAVTENGWSVRFEATDTNYSRARDVAVFADGVPVGTTDATGELVIDLPERPDTLMLDTRVWRVFESSSHHSDIDGATGAIRRSQQNGRLHAYVQRIL